MADCQGSTAKDAASNRTPRSSCRSAPSASPGLEGPTSKSLSPPVSRRHRLRGPVWRLVFRHLLRHRQTGCAQESERAEQRRPERGQSSTDHDCDPFDFTDEIRVNGHKTGYLRTLAAIPGHDKHAGLSNTRHASVGGEAVIHPRRRIRRRAASASVCARDQGRTAVGMNLPRRRYFAGCFAAGGVSFSFRSSASRSVCSSNLSSPRLASCFSQKSSSSL